MSSLRTKDSEVHSKEKIKGNLALTMVYLLVVAGLVAGLVTGMVIMDGKVKSLKQDNQILEENLKDEKQIAKDFETRLQKVSKEMENTVELADALIKNLTLDIRNLKSQMKPFNDFVEKTNLHEAAKSGQLEVVKLLIQIGANVNAMDSKGRTPLHSAAINGNLDIVKLLLKNGAKKNVEDEDDETPLSWAKYQRWFYGGDYYEIINLLENN